jgi:hypothetical protein
MLLALACSVFAQSPQLHSRILGKEGTRSARRWTLAALNGGATALADVKLTGIQVVQTNQAEGAACAPKVKSPPIPFALGTVAPHAAASAVVVIDFAGCSNNAKFSVRADFEGQGGVKGTLLRSNQYR